MFDLMKVNMFLFCSLNILVDISKLNCAVIRSCLPQVIGKLLEALSDVEDPVSYCFLLIFVMSQASIFG